MHTLDSFLPITRGTLWSLPNSMHNYVWRSPHCNTPAPRRGWPPGNPERRRSRSTRPHFPQPEPEVDRCISREHLCKSLVGKHHVITIGGPDSEIASVSLTRPISRRCQTPSSSSASGPQEAFRVGSGAGKQDRHQSFEERCPSLFLIIFCDSPVNIVDDTTIEKGALSFNKAQKLVGCIGHFSCRCFSWRVERKGLELELQ